VLYAPGALPALPSKLARSLDAKRLRFSLAFASCLMYSSSAVADQDFSKNSIEIKYGNVIISDYVWIGANVFISPGVKIGNNSVIGANSVVTKDVEKFSIMGGVPAKLIRFKNQASNVVQNEC